MFVMAIKFNLYVIKWFPGQKDDNFVNMIDRELFTFLKFGSF